MVSAEFELATVEVEKVEKAVSNDDLLLLYAYYKIATGADFSAAVQPGTFDFQGKYKYNAWKKEVDAGVTPEEAEKHYIEKVESLKKTNGFNAATTKRANGKAIEADKLEKFDQLSKKLGRTY